LDLFNFGHHEQKKEEHHKWHLFSNTDVYRHWGRLQLLDGDRKPIRVELGQKSESSCPVTKWIEEKSAKYVAYEAAMRKFGQEADQHKGKCPIMTWFVGESDIQKAMAQEPAKESPFYVEHPEDLAASAVPTAMFHGFGDFCLQPGDIQFNDMIKRGTGAAVKCIEVGMPMVGSIINNFESIAQKSCQKIANDKTFAGEFNVIGLSQGGLLARYIAEECDMPGKVRNIVTLGGPHMGVDAIPHCLSGTACKIVNGLAKKFVYTDLAQDWIAPAGYFRDVNDFKVYQQKSVFLSALNNEKTSTSAYSQLRASKFADINAGLFVMFSDDTMIYPKETAWFQSLNDKGEVMKLEDSEFYKNDSIGIKTLNEAGKLTFTQFKGDHLQFTTDDIKNTIIPFLKK